MERHCENALAVARFLEAHPRVQRVIYPGLASHPQHALAVRQMHGGGGMVTAVLEGGLAEARRFLERCELFALAESLGGVESLIEHPAIMTHASLPAEVRAELGIGDSLVRLSVGVEDVDDLIAELDAPSPEASLPRERGGYGEDVESPVGAGLRRAACSGSKAGVTGTPRAPGRRRGAGESSDLEHLAQGLLVEQPAQRLVPGLEAEVLVNRQHHSRGLRLRGESRGALQRRRERFLADHRHPAGEGSAHHRLLGRRGTMTSSPHYS